MSVAAENLIDFKNLKDSSIQPSLYVSLKIPELTDVWAASFCPYTGATDSCPHILLAFTTNEAAQNALKTFKNYAEEANKTAFDNCKIRAEVEEAEKECHCPTKDPSILLFRSLTVGQCAITFLSQLNAILGERSSRGCIEQVRQHRFTRPRSSPSCCWIGHPKE